MFKHKTEMKPLKHFSSFCLNKIVNLKKKKLNSTPEKPKIKPSNNELWLNLKLNSK